MADQTQRLELATVKAEIGSDILSRFSNDAVVAAEIPTDSGPIPNLKQVIVTIQEDGAEKISFATTIYPTTAAGIAATTDGAIFMVKSAATDEVYEVWQNVVGVATDTGKRALTATAITAAMDSATSSAEDAQESAEQAAARVAPLLGPFAVAPTTRNDSSPLQEGDEYQNTVDHLRYSWNGSAWVALNSSAQSLEDRLADPTDPSNGAGMVAWEREGTVTLGARVHRRLNASAICVWEMADLITNKPDPADPETWDWKPAFDAAYAFAATEYPQGGLRYGKSVEVPGMKYPVSGTVGPTKLGIETVGEGPLTSVITAMTGITGDWVFLSRYAGAGAAMGGCGVRNLGVDCAGLSIGGMNFEDAYDCVNIDNVRVSRVHADKVGFRMGPRTDAIPGQSLSQTIKVSQLFVYKAGGGATVPTVQLIKVQEAQFIGCKSWAGGFGGTARGNTSAWYIEDCRSIDMIGCSAVGAENHGVEVRAATKSTDGIRLRGMLYENCNGATKTSSADAVNFPLKSFVHDLARVEGPFTGNFDFGGLYGGIVDVGPILATMQADTDQNRVFAQRVINVTDLATGSKRNNVESHPNAIDNFMGFSKPLRVISASTPRYTFGATGVTDYAAIEWSRSTGANNGIRGVVNVGGTDVTLFAFKEAPSANNACMTLLINDGTTTTTKQVSIGAADSGGVGYRMLRVLN